MDNRVFSTRWEHVKSIGQPPIGLGLASWHLGAFALIQMPFWGLLKPLSPLQDLGLLGQSE
jgi:hypothetical protein